MAVTNKEDISSKSLLKREHVGDDVTVGQRMQQSSSKNTADITTCMECLRRCSREKYSVAMQTSVANKIMASVCCNDCVMLKQLERDDFTAKLRKRNDCVMQIQQKRDEDTAKLWQSWIYANATHHERDEVTAELCQHRNYANATYDYLTCKKFWRKRYRDGFSVFSADSSGAEAFDECLW